MRRLYAALATLAIAVALAAGADLAIRTILRQRLSSRLDGRPTPAAAELATFSRSDPQALRALALASFDTDRRVAAAARREIDRLLEEWRHAPARRAPDQLRQRAETLATALRDAQGRADRNGNLWAARVVRRLLRIDGDRSTELLAASDAVLSTATTAVGADPLGQLESLETDATPPPPITLSVSPSVAEASRPAPPPARFFTDEPSPLPDALADSPAPPRAFPLESAPTAPGADAQQLREFEPPGDAAPLEPGLAAAAPPWRPSWGKPAPPEPTANASETPAPRESFESLSDLELLERFLPIATRAANAPAAVGPVGRRRTTPRNREAEEDTPEQRLRRLVVARGYGGVATPHVRMLLSDDEAERVRLVAELLRSRVGDSARLLLLLTADDSPRVRFEAIRALGSSPDARLAELAWRRALNDRDPRVAGLAAELRPGQR